MVSYSLSTEGIEVTFPETGSNSELSAIRRSFVGVASIFRKTSLPLSTNTVSHCSAAPPIPPED